jgi:hypothetical protein
MQEIGKDPVEVIMPPKSYRHMSIGEIESYIGLEAIIQIASFVINSACKGHPYALQIMEEYPTSQLLSNYLNKMEEHPTSQLLSYYRNKMEEHPTSQIVGYYLNKFELRIFSEDLDFSVNPGFWIRDDDRLLVSPGFWIIEQIMSRANHGDAAAIELLSTSCPD